MAMVSAQAFGRSSTLCPLVMMMVNLRSVLLSIAWFSAAILPAVCAADSFDDQLRSVCRVVGTELPLRVVAQRIGDAHGINVWIDRRVDPSTPVSLSAAAGSLQQTLEAIAAKSQLEVGYASPVVILAPQGVAIDTATRILKLRSEMKQLPISAATRLLEPQDLAWDRLSTPAEIAQQIAAAWQVSVVGESLPHDLWDRCKLQGVDAADALVLLAAGFDLAPNYNPQQATFGFDRIEKSVGVALEYPSTKVAAGMARELRKIDPDVKLEKRGALIRVTGNSAVHHRIRSDRSAAKPKQNGGLADVAPGMRRFTLRIPGMKPAASILQAVCNASGFTLDTSAASSENLKRPVGLEVEDQLATAIIESICTQAGLTVRFDATTAVVADRP